VGRISVRFRAVRERDDERLSLFRGIPLRNRRSGVRISPGALQKAPSNQGVWVWCRRGRRSLLPICYLTLHGRVLVRRLLGRCSPADDHRPGSVLDAGNWHLRFLRGARPSKDLAYPPRGRAGPWRSWCRGCSNSERHAALRALLLDEVEGIRLGWLLPRVEARARPRYPSCTDHRSLMASLSPKRCGELEGFDRSSQGSSQHALQSTNHRHEPVELGGV
jgi:hypothetical protein